MRKLLVGVLAVVALIGATALPSDAGWHGGWHHAVFVGPRVVVGVGVPFVVAPPIFYPRPYVYAAPVVVAAPAPVVVAPPPVVYPPARPSWYYCQNPVGYYPSIPQCSTGWVQVAPQTRY